MSEVSSANKRLRIVLAISTMGPGGAEKVMSIMANYWVQHGHYVTLVTISDNDSFYNLNSKVKYQSLKGSRKSESFFSAIINNCIRLVRLIKIFKSIRPDVIISFTTSMNILCIIAARYLRVPVIVSERYNPYKFIPNKLWNTTRKYLYPKSTYIVVQSKLAKNYFLSFCKSNKVEIIYNPVDKETFAPLSLNRKENIILNVARLKYVKGQDLLLKAFALSGIMDWELHLVGEGEERKKLEMMIDSLGLRGRVFLPGEFSPIVNYYHRARIFVLSSRAEGFPNCLLEAMSCGLPVISMNCETGPTDIIEEGKNGILVPNKDIHSLAKALKNLVDSPEERERLGKAAEKSIDKFNVDVIMERWERLIFNSMDSI